MKIASFNINDVNKRLGNLIGWLRAEKPDVVALQELKAADREFPKAAIEKAGYGAMWRGQKTWNGVAILARGCEPIVDAARIARRSRRKAGALYRGGGQRRHRRLTLCAERQSAAGAKIRLQAHLDGASAGACQRALRRWRANGAGQNRSNTRGAAHRSDQAARSRTNLDSPQHSPGNGRTGPQQALARAPQPSRASPRIIRVCAGNGMRGHEW